VLNSNLFCSFSRIVTSPTPPPEVPKSEVKDSLAARFEKIKPLCPEPNKYSAVRELKKEYENDLSVMV
jgi:hypothetical protein